MLMVIFMRVNGLKIKLMDLEHTHIVMGLNMLDSGRMIYSMEKEKKIGLMEQIMKAIINLAKNMVMVNYSQYVFINCKGVYVWVDGSKYAG